LAWGRYGPLFFPLDKASSLMILVGGTDLLFSF
jgi:hypothetical protein